MVTPYLACNIHICTNACVYVCIKAKVGAARHNYSRPRVSETDFPISGSNVSYKLGYFSNSRLKFLNSFLRNITSAQFLRGGGGGGGRVRLDLGCHDTLKYYFS